MTRIEIEIIVLIFLVILVGLTNTLSPTFNSFRTILLYLSPLYIGYLVRKYYERLDQLINNGRGFRDFFNRDWAHLKNDYQIISKNNTKKISKFELAEKIHNRGVLRPEKRIRINFEDICVNLAIKAHNLFNKTGFKTKITEEIESKVKNSEFDLILLSSSLANNQLKSCLEAKFGKDVFSYSLENKEIKFDIPDEMITIKNRIRDKLSCNILVVESALFSPRIIYRLISRLKRLSEAYDINFQISHLIVIFAAKNNFSDFRSTTKIKMSSLFEIDKGIRACGNCNECHWGNCSFHPEIAKWYLL